MVSINDATGDEMKSRTSNNEYRTGWDRIFGKKKEQVEEPAKPEDNTSGDSKKE